MPNLGIPELLVILMILVLVFGGSRLPQIGESLGRTARSFKRAIASNDEIKVEASETAAATKPSAQLEAPSGEAPGTKISDAELVDKKS